MVIILILDQILLLNELVLPSFSKNDLKERNSNLD